MSVRQLYVGGGIFELQREGLLGAACDNTWAGHNSFAALALGILVDSCGRGAYLGRGVSYEEMLKGE